MNFDCEISRVDSIFFPITHRLVVIVSLKCQGCSVVPHEPVTHAFKKM